jgi:hypothetical protein
MDIQRNNEIIIEHFAADNITVDRITEDMLKSSFARLNIFFNDIQYMRIVQSPLRLPIDLLSSVGG